MIILGAEYYVKNNDINKIIINSSSSFAILVSDVFVRIICLGSWK